MIILLAEDDPCIRRVAEIALARTGHRVTAVADGKAALEQALTGKFDLVVLDGMMPYMDGLDVCKRLKSDPALRHIPVVLLTARSQGSDEEAAAEAGADAYIRKPFDALTLPDQIRRVSAAMTVAA